MQIERIKEKIFLTSLLILILPFMATAAVNPPAIPLTVYGDVKIDNNPAPIGTIVTIFDNSAEIIRTTISQAGKYFLEVPAGNVGKTLTYKVNNITAVSAICPNSLVTPSLKLDLAVITPLANPPSGNSSGSGGSGSGGAGNGGGGGGGGGNFSNPLLNTNSNAASPEPIASSTTSRIEPRVLGEKIVNFNQTVNAIDEQLKQILLDAAAIYSEKLETILANASSSQDIKKEKNSLNKHVKLLAKAIKNITNKDNNRLNYFITYGTKSAKILGEGERAGVLNSYKSTFNKLPITETEWQDLLKISNGRWPSATNTLTEFNAKKIFNKIYGREADLSNPRDVMAVKIIAYGLRPSKRNLDSEKAAIKSFRYFMKKSPSSAIDWDTVRAIAYSGAKR